MSTPDAHIKCQDVVFEGRSWCNAEIDPDTFSFDDTEYAAIYARRYGSKHICSKCIEAVKVAFEASTWVADD